MIFGLWTARVGKSYWRANFWSTNSLREPALSGTTFLSNSLMLFVPRSHSKKRIERRLEINCSHIVSEASSAAKRWPWCAFALLYSSSFGARYFSKFIGMPRL
jgi:hypothetical protein